MTQVSIHVNTIDNSLHFYSSHTTYGRCHSMQVVQPLAGTPETYLTILLEVYLS